MNHVSGSPGPESVVRAIATAGKTLRLYPPSSALPRQSVDVALRALREFFVGGDSALVLAVERTGLSWGGGPLGGALGASALIDQFRDHAIAELTITPGCTPDELLTFLTLLEKSPEDLREEGGLELSLRASLVESIRVSDVRLTVIDAPTIGPEEDLSDFLLKLAGDPERLAIWFRAASAGDPRTFEEGLAELVRVSGPGGYEALLRSLSSAFLSQSADGKDALLGLAMEPGPTRDLTGDVFGKLGTADIAGSVCEGLFGRNMLSLSSALTKLPLAEVSDQVRAEVQAMLAASEHTGQEARFLEHMLEVRESSAFEPPLIDTDTTYRAVAKATRLPEDVLAQARGAVTGSALLLSAAGVRTILSLLDQQTDLELFCDTAARLASLVPGMIGQGDLGLALRVLSELSERETMQNATWPTLSARMREIHAEAGGADSMAPLIGAVAADPSRLPVAKTIVAHASEQGLEALVGAAVELKEVGLGVADHLLGRRLIDHLNYLAPGLPGTSVAAVAARLADAGDPHSIASLDAFMQRPDEESRREVIKGLTSVSGPVAERIIMHALRDPSIDVAIHAIRVLANSGDPRVAVTLITRLKELSVDTTDFTLGSEIIVGLTRLPGSAVDEELVRLAGRRSFIKRGHFGEVQDLVRQTMEVRAREGVSR